jgi:hypothetical protein
MKVGRATPESPARAPGLGQGAAELQHAATGWLLSVAIGLVVGAVVGLVLLLVPHLIVKRLPWGGRELRVLLATAFMLGSTAGLIALAARLSRSPEVPR